MIINEVNFWLQCVLYWQTLNPLKTSLNFCTRSTSWSPGRRTASLRLKLTACRRSNSGESESGETFNLTDTEIPSILISLLRIQLKNDQRLFGFGPVKKLCQFLATTWALYWLIPQLGLGRFRFSKPGSWQIPVDREPGNWSGSKKVHKKSFVHVFRSFILNQWGSYD